MTDYTKLLAEVVAEAERNLGYGEVGKNNVGPFIDAIGGHVYGEPAWCALFAGWCYRKASSITGIALPFNPWRRAGTPEGGIPEAGAQTLVSRVQVAGKAYTDPRQARPGDLVLWSREGGHHVGIVTHGGDVITQTVEGNTGSFPSKVRRLTHDVHHEPHFVRFATIAL